MFDWIRFFDALERSTMYNKNVRLCIACDWLWLRRTTATTKTTTNMQEKCLCPNSQTDKKNINDCPLFWEHHIESQTHRILEFKSQMSTWLAYLCECVWYGLFIYVSFCCFSLPFFIAWLRLYQSLIKLSVWIVQTNIPKVIWKWFYVRCIAVILSYRF